MESKAEIDCNNLESLFQHIISDMKFSFPIWEDFTSKANKLHTCLKATVIASSSFLEAFQKVADLAAGSRGTVSDLAATLTRLCMRQRAIEEKLRSFASAIHDSLANLLQQRLEEWRKAVVQLEKDHGKEYKKAHQETKKTASETVRLCKKAKKGKADILKQLESAQLEYNAKVESFASLERNAVKMALTQERNHYCQFVTCLRPVMDSELALLSEVSHLQDVMGCLSVQAAQPFSITSSENFNEVKRTRTLPADLTKATKSTPLSSPLSPCKSNVRSSSNLNSTLQPIIKRSSERSGSPACVDSRKTPVHSPSSSVGMKSSNSLWSSFSDQTSLPRATSALKQTAPPPVSQQSSEPCFSSPVKNNPYAVPSTWNPESFEVLQHPADVSACETPTGLPSQECTCGMTLPNEDPMVSNVKPIAGYVNMNELACMAVQQQDSIEKSDKVTNLAATLPSTDKTSRRIVKISDSPFNSVRAVPQRSMTVEDILVAGEPLEMIGRSTYVLACSEATAPDLDINQTAGSRGRLNFELIADAMLESCRELSTSIPYFPCALSNRRLNFNRSLIVLPSASKSLKRGTSDHRGPMRDHSLPPISRRPSKSSDPKILPPRQGSNIPAFNPRCLSPPNNPQMMSNMLDDDIDDLPLPPMPEELANVNSSNHILSATLLGTENIAPPTDLICNASDQSASFCDEQDGGSFAASIRRGIKLRSIHTDDRSAPRLN